MIDVLLFVGLFIIPLTPLALFFVPPEWVFDIHEDDTIGRSVNTILWLQMRLGHWES